MSALHFYLHFAEMNLFLIWFIALWCMYFVVVVLFSFPILLNSVVDCFLRSGHNSGEEGFGKSINIAVEQSPGEEWTYGM